MKYTLEVKGPSGEVKTYPSHDPRRTISTYARIFGPDRVVVDTHRGVIHVDASISRKRHSTAQRNYATRR